MQNLTRFALSIGGAALFAACGGAQPLIGPPNASQAGIQSKEGMKRSAVIPTYEVSGPLLYVVSFDETLTPLAIYNAKADDPEPIATISKDIDNSSGACIDGDGTL
jgi:hypothetical protein